MRNKDTIRIISGTLRNSKIKVIDRPLLRPTKERLRETIFNWLAHKIKGAFVLDIFSGTGVFGIESLSRNASYCVFIDIDPLITENISNMLNLLNVRQLATVINEDVFLEDTFFLERADIVFADPPFTYNEIFQKKLLKFLWEAVSDRCQVVLECKTSMDIDLTCWKILRKATTGKSSAFLLEKVLI